MCVVRCKGRAARRSGVDDLTCFAHIHRHTHNRRKYVTEPQNARTHSVNIKSRDAQRQLHALFLRGFVFVTRVAKNETATRLGQHAQASSGPYTKITLWLFKRRINVTTPLGQHWSDEKTGKKKAEVKSHLRMTDKSVWQRCVCANPSRWMRA